MPLPLPMPMPMPMPMPSIDGDGLVHMLPIGPPEFIPELIDVSQQGNASHADFGIQRAMMVTAMGAEAGPATPIAAGQIQGRAKGVSQQTAGMRPGSIMKASTASGAAASHAEAGPARIQPVGQIPMDRTPRWRDRFRFSWPMGND